MPRTTDAYFENAGTPHELGQRSGAHLLHDTAAMNLQSVLADTELGGRLFV
jgi:hypothetical protein